MTGDDLQDLTQGLVDAHERVSNNLKWRPRKAAKDLCEEFRVLAQKGDFWNQFETTARDLESFEKQSEEVFSNVRKLIADEARILSRLGVDELQIGNILSSVYDAIDIANARTADTTSQGIRNLRSRLSHASELICSNSRGPLLHALDFVVSKKGAVTLAALGLGGANIWFAVTADGGTLSHVSMKVATAAAHGHLNGIIELLGG